MKTKTINLQGKEYAQVADRLLQFRTENPRGSVETIPTMQPDGQILFKAHIVKDRGDIASAEATGHALGTNKGQKAFEKLETIAVGRALALLGYAASGEIASSEEMEEFEEHKKNLLDEMLLAATEKLEDCKTLDELKVVWGDFPIEVKKMLEDLKEKMKAKISTPVVKTVRKVKKVEPPAVVPEEPKTLGV